MKILNKLGIERNFFNLRMSIYTKSIVNIILNGERVNAFHLRSGIRQTCLLLTVLFSIVVEVLASAVRQEKELKGIFIGMKRVNCLFF